MKLLVADDDRVSRTLTQRTLERFGYEVIVAEDGRTALEILSGKDAPRLALIDWIMPEMDGPALCREVRALHREGGYVYILLLTSKQSSGDIVAGLEAGADDYITKPCQPAELSARLRTGCRILSLEEKLVQAREEMRYKATHDVLTGTWNRGSILSLVQDELDRSLRQGTSTSVLMCDVDHFKQVNDRHGHMTGDIVLEEVAKRITASIRSYDAVGRYGGEEFLVLLSDCDAYGLESRCESIRSAIAASAIDAGGDRVPVTISIGAVTCQNRDAQLPLARILSAADEALYRAKAGGRNRAVVNQILVTA